MKQITLAVLILCAGVACSGPGSQADQSHGSFSFDWSSYGRLLGLYVAEGRVNYAALQANRMVLDSLVNDMAEADLSSATKDQKLAFYINTYNVLTLRSIIDHYPVASIKDIDGVWDKTKWPVAGRRLTLNEIEHEVLRKDFTEPRIHFAIVCASIGCPPLSPIPYMADSIDQQLEQAAHEFAADSAYNTIDPEAGTAELSSIFDWFGDDLVPKFYNPATFPGLSKKENAALNFIISQYPEDARARMLSAKYAITYREYDWSLNVRL